MLYDNMDLNMDDRLHQLYYVLLLSIILNGKYQDGLRN